MKARTLIYLVAFGRTCGGYASKCAKTLRDNRLGQYQGEIVVFADEAAMDELSGVKGDVTLAALSLPSGPKVDSAYWAMRGRVSAAPLIACDSYSHVCYLDCDILAARDVAQLFDAPEELSYTYEPPALWSSHYSHAFLTPEELLEAEASQVSAINSGSFVVPGRLASLLFAEWRRLLDSTEPVLSARNPTPDQAAFNALIYRGLVPAKPMPYGRVIQPSPHISYPDAILLHFAVNRKTTPFGFAWRFEQMMLGTGPHLKEQACQLPS